MGLILGTRTRLGSLSEEHGVARVGTATRFRVGERVRILPNHACVVSNLHDRLYGVARAATSRRSSAIGAWGRIQ